MKDAVNALQTYRRFLESIPLDRYRDELKDVKWVEQDLYPELLPLVSVFRNYWHRQNFLDFETWFEQFWGELHSNRESLIALKAFKKYYFDKEDDGWFKLGFKARMYRTWVSVLTQLDFCYMFVYVCKKQGKHLMLEANAELDAQGINLRVGELDFQVGKITHRKEARPSEEVIKKKITIPYAVYNIDEYKRLSVSPRVSEISKRKYRNAIQAFDRYFVTLKNGFVVFSEFYVMQIVANLDNSYQLQATINALRREIADESES